MFYMISYKYSKEHCLQPQKNEERGNQYEEHNQYQRTYQRIKRI